MDSNKSNKNNFLKNELNDQKDFWRILCKMFFNKFINPEDTVIDIGAGYCGFINNIDCKKKIALDLNEEIKNCAAEDVKIINESCYSIDSLAENSVDVAFMNNFLEHLESKQDIYEVLKETKRIIKPGGKLMILQPNIKYCGDKYWDSFEHYMPLSDKSIEEVLKMLDMEIIKIIPRFLPYPINNEKIKTNFLLKLYLMFPILWKLIGEQVFIIAQKKSKSEIKE